MARIRPFRREDIPRVARLWEKVFRQGRPAGSQLEAYFDRIFFGNPWRTDDLPCLLAEDAAGRPLGFLGVIPRPMEFRGRSLRAAVSTQFMVDPGHRDPTLALRMLRTFLEGPQELSFSDGGSQPAARLWERAGGRTALLYCLEWIRVLRPVGRLAFRLSRRGGRWAAPGRLLAWAGMPIDACLHLASVRRRRPGSLLQEKPANADAILEFRSGDPRPAALRPRYDPAALRWLLDVAAEAVTFGKLRVAAVRDPEGETVGWYALYSRSGGVSHVLQIEARAGSFPQVVEHLAEVEWRRGSVALSGPVDPRFLPELGPAKATIFCPGPGVFVHSRDPEILAAVCSGDALLGRLDGEWWLRFGIDRNAAW